MNRAANCVCWISGGGGGSRETVVLEELPEMLHIITITGRPVPFSASILGGYRSHLGVPARQPGYLSRSTL